MKKLCQKFNISIEFWHNTGGGLSEETIKELHDIRRSDAWISKHLGMDRDEILRLKQITGLAALFKDKEFGKAKIAADKEQLLSARYFLYFIIYYSCFCIKTLVARLTHGKCLSWKRSVKYNRFEQIILIHCVKNKSA